VGADAEHVRPSYSTSYLRAAPSEGLGHTTRTKGRPFSGLGCRVTLERVADPATDRRRDGTAPEPREWHADYSPSEHEREWVEEAFRRRVRGDDSAARVGSPSLAG
jgi:hypothetical protein